MSRTIKKSITITPEEWEMARAKSVLLFGFENRSGYIRGLIKEDKPTRL